MSYYEALIERVEEKWSQKSFPAYNVIHISYGLHKNSYQDI